MDAGTAVQPAGVHGLAIAKVHDHAICSSILGGADGPRLVPISPGRRARFADSGIFGMEHHLTTVLCRDALAEVTARDRPRSMLDVCSGPGALALGALLLEVGRTTGSGPLPPMPTGIGSIKQGILARHCLHAEQGRLKVTVLDIDFDARREWSLMAVRTQVVGGAAATAPTAASTGLERRFR